MVETGGDNDGGGDSITGGGGGPSGAGGGGLGRGRRGGGGGDGIVKSVRPLTSEQPVLVHPDSSLWYFGRLRLNRWQ